MSRPDATLILKDLQILLTGPQEGSEKLAGQLTLWGAKVRHVPLIDISPVSFKRLEPAGFSWLMFTSRNGVRTFYERVLGENPDWNKIPVATVGPVTAEAVRQFGITPQYIAPRFDALSAAQDFARHHASANLHCLWPCGNLASTALQTTLVEAGIHVTPLVVYQTTERALSPEEQASLKEPCDWLIFSSPSAVRAYAALNPEHVTGEIACIGPRTAQTAQQVLGRCTIQAPSYTLDALGKAIYDYLSSFIKGERESRMTLNPVIERLAQSPETLRANWTLPPEDAKFLYLLARIGKVTRMLEVGTSIGFSTLHLAQAASQQDGMVTTIDASAERQSEAKQNVSEAGLSSFVEFKLGDALTVLEELFQQGRRFDFMFLDARKSEYLDYLGYAEKFLEPGGILLADNTQSHRDDMQDFIQAVARSERWESCDMPTPNGFVLARLG